MPAGAIVGSLDHPPTRLLRFPEFVGTDGAAPRFTGIPSAAASVDEHDRLGRYSLADAQPQTPVQTAAATTEEDQTMKVSEAMTRGAQIARPDETLQDVARRMAAEDIGFLPVGDDDRLVGTITDRDIVVRAVAQGRDGTALVRDAMTRDVKYCFEDDDMDHVMHNMADIQVRRLPVVDRDKRLVGVISLADGALKDDPETAGIAFTGVVMPGGSHATTG